MGITPEDRELWDAVVAAEGEAVRARAAFHQQASARAEVLSEALRADGVSAVHALSFLGHLSDDVPLLTEQLVGRVLSVRTALAAKQALERASWSEENRLEIRRIVEGHLPTADEDEWRRLGELLWYIRDVEALRHLVDRAAASEDPAVREAAEDLAEWL
ncbi:hypothetical protein [Kitasatospora sp. NPDC101183]|uniref:hypothetical protein n=1 Tax=Kitasatospora sp. NPDC101183 TaxID=3364100 RepID=UPI0038045590